MKLATYLSGFHRPSARLTWSRTSRSDIAAQRLAGLFPSLRLAWESQSGRPIPSGYSRLDGLDSIAPKSCHVGPFGVGMTTKLVTNLLVVVNSMALAEAMVLGNLSGLDSERMLKAVSPSAGGSAVLNYRGPMMAKRTYRPAAGRAPIVMKDLVYIRDHARAIGAATPLVETALDWFKRMLEEGRAEDECAGIYEVILGASPGPITDR